MHSESKDPPLRRRISPGRRVIGLELRTGDIEAVGRLEGHRGQTRRLAPLRAVVIVAVVHPAQVEAVDHAGVAIGNEQAVGSGIEGEPAERGPRIGHAVKHDIGEEAHLTRHAIDAPDRAWAAALVQWAEQAEHETRIWRALLDPIGLAVAVAIRHDNGQAVGGFALSSATAKT